MRGVLGLRDQIVQVPKNQGTIK